MDAVSERRVRKTVTVVFADVSESTALAERVDAETSQAMLARYFDAMRAVVERHGGIVEKFIGDAVMAVFGVPQAHEDDVLRAVRAAAEMRAALADLNEALERDHHPAIAVRIGVNTGEVVAGDPRSGQSFASGDAVNVAARLEQSAAPGEILLGDSTYRLIRGLIRAEEVEALAVKGKREPVKAWRLLDLVADGRGHPERGETPFVGREPELGALWNALEDVERDSICSMVTLIGEPGVGKSRLVQQFLAASGERARSVVGRCLPYGDSITYRPLADIVRDAVGSDVAALRELIGDDLATGPIAGAVGLEGSEASCEETQWAARKLLEAMARQRPLIVVMDDVHWAEPTFLDLVEYVSSFSSGAPILLLCIARPDLLETRPSWASPRAGTRILPLKPLSEVDAAALIVRLAPQLSEDERRRVLDTAEGNPLFVEHLLAFFAEGRGGQAGVPPSLNGLLSARIDGLESAQRAAIECAAIQGRIFHRGAIAALLPAEARPVVARTLLGLSRTGLVQPARSEFAGDDAFRFAHILIRDAAYEGILKRHRADLHGRFAEWLQDRASGRMQEYDEVVGYHLESAFRYRVEIAPRDDLAAEQGVAAAAHLGSAGERALARGDIAAAIRLLERATGVLAAGAPTRPNLCASLGMARAAAGDLEQALQALTEAAESAADAGHTRGRAAVERARIGLLTGAVSADAAQAAAQRAIATLGALGDDVGLAKAWLLLALAHNWRLEFSALERAAEHALLHARRAGAARDAADAILWTAPAIVLGPRPVRDAVEHFERIASEAPGPLIEAAALWALGCLRLMLGEPDVGRDLYRRSEAIYRDLGLRHVAAGQATLTSWCELMAGDAAEAEALARAGLAELEEMGERWLQSGTATELARVLCTLGRYDEAAQFLALGEELSGQDDTFNAIIAAGVRARVEAATGDPAAALRAAEEAVTRARAVDCLELTADAHRALAEALRSAGERDRAEDALGAALQLYQQKQNLVAAQRTREELASLTAG
jgi:class 3 adenylate cyclase/tetratricopeptide (TPR) repeat protein